jgi:hypothetical protein
MEVSAPGRWAGVTPCSHISKRYFQGTLLLKKAQIQIAAATVPIHGTSNVLTRIPLGINAVSIGSCEG